MKNITLTLAAMVVLFQSLPARAEVSWQDGARVRLLLHGGKQLTESLKIKGTFIPSGNLVGGLSPLMYLGLNINLPKGWAIAPTAGYSFAADENSPIIAVQISFENDLVMSWSDVEYSMLPHHCLYWFSQLEGKATDWLMLGIEGEGWGRIDNINYRSDGGGLNILFVFKMFEIDLAVHARTLAGTSDTGFELVTRVHAFLF
ncbi:MAG TPA: hypothetical protein VMX18_03255 [Candidatus Bipolaricaulota bacterium]|nr:hypothetical protein [Candidatus Bipolaricaulota bacterium]